MSPRAKLASLLTLAALATPLAACGDEDVEGEVDQAREEIQRQAKAVEGKIDDLSTRDLRMALRDAREAAESGSEDAKREARELERKIERELRERN